MKLILPVWGDRETVERQKKADTEVERKLDIARYKRKRPIWTELPRKADRDSYRNRAKLFT